MLNMNISKKHMSVSQPEVWLIVLEYLQTVLQDPTTQSRQNRAICLSIHDVISQSTVETSMSKTRVYSNVMISIKRLWKHWPSFSGSHSFPVPHSSLSPIEAYSSCDGFWTGEYGQKRIELVEFLVNEISDWLKQNG